MCSASEATARVAGMCHATNAVEPLDRVVAGRAARQSASRSRSADRRYDDSEQHRRDGPRHSTGVAVVTSSTRATPSASQHAAFTRWRVGAIGGTARGGPVPGSRPGCPTPVRDDGRALRHAAPAARTSPRGRRTAAASSAGSSSHPDGDDHVAADIAQPGQHAREQVAGLDVEHRAEREEDGTVDGPAIAGLERHARDTAPASNGNAGSRSPGGTARAPAGAPGVDPSWRAGRATTLAHPLARQ